MYGYIGPTHVKNLIIYKHYRANYKNVRFFLKLEKKDGQSYFSVLLHNRRLVDARVIAN